jgi:hypothetical protein
LAVPVFYSIFDDVSEWQIFRRLGDFSSRIFGGLKRKVQMTASSLFSLAGKE